MRIFLSNAKSIRKVISNNQHHHNLLKHINYTHFLEFEYKNTIYTKLSFVLVFSKQEVF